MVFAVKLVSHLVCTDTIIFFLVFRVSIVTTCPIIISLLGVNNASPNFTDLLQQNNIILSEANVSSCAFLESTIEAWLELGASVQTGVPQYDVKTFVLWAQLLPVRCDFQGDDGVITVCPNGTGYPRGTCDVWNEHPANASDATPEYYANKLGIRVGGITEYAHSQNSRLTIATDGNFSSYPNMTFSVRLLANENHAVAFV